MWLSFGAPEKISDSSTKYPYASGKSTSFFFLSFLHLLTIFGIFWFILRLAIILVQFNNNFRWMIFLLFHLWLHLRLYQRRFTRLSIFCAYRKRSWARLTSIDMRRLIWIWEALWLGKISYYLEWRSSRIQMFVGVLFLSYLFEEVQRMHYFQKDKIILYII